MVITDGAWLTPETVHAHLGVDSSEAPSVEPARLAAAAQVEVARPDLLVPIDGSDATWQEVNGDLSWDDLEDPSADWSYSPTSDVFYAALLITARLYARKGSPTGIASYGEFGPAAVLRFDPDVERLLMVGRYGKPRIG